MNNKKFTIRHLCACGVIAALYAALTIATASFAYGPIQFRVAEALIVLCWFEPLLTVGVTLGCFLANVFSTVSALDMIVGTAATLLACLWTVKCRKKWFVPMPNVLCNAVIIGLMLAFVLTPDAVFAGFWTFAAQVGLGELVVMYLLGLPLLAALERSGVMSKIFPKSEKK